MVKAATRRGVAMVAHFHTGVKFQNLIFPFYEYIQKMILGHDTPSQQG